MSNLVNDIKGFLRDHKARRGQQLASDALSITPPTYYPAPGLSLSDVGTIDPLTIATTTSSTYMPSCVDKPSPQFSSVYTEPTPVAFPPSQPHVASPLVCEFIHFSECDAIFDPSDEAGWITHIVKDHLDYRFPLICTCWFCDRLFKAPSQAQADAEACYRKRMHHIAKHFRRGLSPGQMRPDLFFLDHLHENGLIDGNLSLEAQTSHDAPIASLPNQVSTVFTMSPQHISNPYPAGCRSEYRNEIPLVIEDNPSTLAHTTARSCRRSRGYPTVDDYATPPAVHQSNPTPNPEHPFKCDHCVKSFSANRDLKKHKRIHLGVRSFLCRSCNKSFSRKDHLMRHRLYKGCGRNIEEREEDTELDYNSTDIVAKYCKPGMNVSTEDQLTTSSSVVFSSKSVACSNDSRESKLPSQNTILSPMVKLETNPSEEPVETFTTPSPPNWSQQHTLPILSKLPEDLESSISSQIPQSDGSSSATEMYIEERKRQIVDSIVCNATQRLLMMFDSCRKNVRGNSTGKSGTPEKSLGSSSEAKSFGPIMPNNQKRKLTQMDHGETDDDDSEGHGEDLQSGKKPIQNRVNQKYACPYFKYNPTKYKDWRICPGPGWANIHRLKEHLYRRHRQPKYRCGRCWQPFKDEQCYMNHLRTEEACPLREMEHIEGFDAAQERTLKSRKRPDRELSEDDKWKRVFKILFPHVLDDEIPSPFYEYDQTCQKEDYHQHSESDYLAQCEDYMVREVPQRLRQALGRELDRDLTIVEESLRRKAGDWVKTLLEEAFRELRQNRGTSRPGTNEEMSLPIEGQSLQVGSSESSNLLESESWANFALDSIDPLMFLGETEFAFDNGGLIEELLRPEDGDDSETRKLSDSGYGSHSSIQLEK